jgi:hypothetical protein
MNDIKEVLVFISFVFKRFFINMAVHLLYLIVVLGITIPVFFLGYKTFKNHYAFIGFLVALVIINTRIRKFLFKHQLFMNAHFVLFLDDRETYMQSGEKTPLPGDLKQNLDKVRNAIKTQGIGRVSRKLMAALTAMMINREQFNIKEYVSHGRTVILAYFFFQLVMIMLLWIPFALVSILFIGNLSASVQYLIFLVGFFFVYFLNAAIIDPLMSLMVQKRLHEN